MNIQIRKKLQGYIMLQAILATIAYSMIAVGVFTIFSSSFSSLHASNIAIQAQQYAELDAHLIKLIDYDELDNETALGEVNLHTVRGAIQTVEAVGWEDEISIGEEQDVDDDSDSKYRIATIKIYKEGEALARYSVEVPLSSKESNVKKGMILAWSGALDEIPYGWQICNGTNGTPDLRDKFILGAGGKRSVHNTGGEENHTLTLSEMPSHSHNWQIGYEWAPVSDSVDSYSMSTFADLIGYNNGAWGSGTYSPQPTSYSGSGKSHNNMPPYYVLAYIMKI